MPITDRFIIACILINTIIMMFKISPRPDRLGEAGWPVNLANKDNDYMDSGWYVLPPQHRALLCTHTHTHCNVPPLTPLLPACAVVLLLLPQVSILIHLQPRPNRHLHDREHPQDGRLREALLPRLYEQV